VGVHGNRSRISFASADGASMMSVDMRIQQDGEAFDITVYNSA
jgi:hypothetical protein